MEKQPPKFITPFDFQTIPQWLYMIKLMLPYTPSSMQRSLALFIRFQEMQYTLKNFIGFNKDAQYENPINEIKPYLDPSAQEMMDQMESMMNMMEMLQALQSTSSENTDSFNPDIFSELFNMKGDSLHE